MESLPFNPEILNTCLVQSLKLYTETGNSAAGTELRQAIISHKANNLNLQCQRCAGRLSLEGHVVHGVAAIVEGPCDTYDGTEGLASLL